MPVIIFSPKASEDLDSIKAYIESELGGPILSSVHDRFDEILHRFFLRRAAEGFFVPFT